jgi:hypothetical protein
MRHTRGSFFGHGQFVRLAGIAAVFILGIGAFASGVHTSGVEDMPELPVLAWVLGGG